MVMVLALAGCFGGSKRGGAGDGAGAPNDESTEEVACDGTAGVLQGGVYYWAPPGEPDSLAADSVDVLITRGGPTFRTVTSPTGTFSLIAEAGSWSLAADDHSGCLSERVQTVEVEPCETTDVTLLIDLCSY